MPESATLTASFQALRDRATSGMPPPVPGPDDAPAALTDTIGATILPRVVTLAAEDGSRVDLTVRNRRVLGVASIHPPDLWQGPVAPAEAGSDAGPEDFAQPLARAVLAVSARGSVRIGSRLPEGPIPAISVKGYPATQLSGAIETIRTEPQVHPVHRFRDACQGHARAWSGEEAGVDIPEGGKVDEPWISARLSEWSAAAGDTMDLRFVRVGGAPPAALALAAAGGECCVVACHEPDDFDRLEAALLTLRDQSGGI